MDTYEKILHKGDKAPVHLKPKSIEGFRIQEGIDYNFDTLQVRYNDKYAGAIVTFIFQDANGHESSYTKTLEKGGAMSWMNRPSENSNFGSIAFKCDKEVIFEFGVN